jgi:molybdate transport repressor ModE-like protein
MKIGALIVTTGLPRVSGVTALLPAVGAISAGQRMISAVQCADVSLVGLVVGPEDKKSERQLAQNGVIFLRCPEGTDFFRGLQEGLSFMRGKFDRVFVVPGDIPLFLPSTLRAMLKSTAPMVVPETRHVNGYPLLLDTRAMEFLLSQPDFAAAEREVRQGALALESVRVEDVGILLRGEDMSSKKELIEQHSVQLSRPVMDVAIHGSTLLYDPRLSTLLHLVEYTRSVQDACSLMQMSYSTAWHMLNHVEDELGFPLVMRNRGGASGTGTVLTEKGKRLMDAYDQFAARMKKEADLLYSGFFSDSMNLP